MTRKCQPPSRREVLHAGGSAGGRASLHRAKKTSPLLLTRLSLSITV